MSIWSASAIQALHTGNLGVSVPERLGIMLSVLQSPLASVRDSLQVITPMFGAGSDEALIFPSTPVRETLLHSFFFICLFFFGQWLSYRKVSLRTPHNSEEQADLCR